MNSKTTTILVTLALLVIVANSCLFVVKETEKAVQLRFGRIVEPDLAPGLHVKLPLADDVRYFDARILTIDAPSESFITVENKRLIADSYAKWRIRDVETYYKATGGDERAAEVRIARRINDGLRNQFGVRTLHEVVSGERDQLMINITAELNKTAREALGVEVVDVRVKRIDLPPDVSQEVFERMRTQRAEAARQYRATGTKEAEEIRAGADAQVTIIGAEAYREAEQKRGEGDALATATYAEAYQQDPDFYAFTRSLTAYKKTFANKGDIILVDPESDFFSYLKGKNGR